MADEDHRVPVELIHTSNGNEIAAMLHNQHLDQPEEDTSNGFGYENSNGSKVDSEISGVSFIRSLSADSNDAWGFGTVGITGRQNQRIASMPVEKDAESYNMGHKRRGLALIFNHKNFDPRLGLKPRNGTDADRDNLRMTLRQLDFDVKVFNDLPLRDIERILDATSNENHSEADCVLVFVMSHGELGILYASDNAYKPERLWYNFNAERCPTLAGKPKMFFIQACQGDQLDDGIQLKEVNHTSQTDSGSSSYKIPSHADFLIAYSTIPGFYSWRNTTAGSWFVQALCQVLRRYGRSRDLLSNLTRVSRKVAFEFQSNTPGDFVMHEKKQIPCVTSMLTRDVYFPCKV